MHRLKQIILAFKISEKLRIYMYKMNHFRTNFIIGTHDIVIKNSLTMKYRSQKSKVLNFKKQNKISFQVTIGEKSRLMKIIGYTYRYQC